MSWVMFPELIKALFIIAILLPLNVWGDISLENYLGSADVELYWDAISRRGVLWRGTQMISFIPDVPLVSRNFQQLHEVEPIYYRAGGLYIPDDTVDYFKTVFVPLDNQPRKISTIFIDPGHGGKDPGTIGSLANGDPIYEKNIVLEIGLILERQLKEYYPEKRIVISRSEDEYLTLEERTAMANSLSNDSSEKIVFISIHANAALSPNAKGTEVWYLPPEYRRQLLSEDDVDESAEGVVPILNDLLEEEYSVESIILAQSIDRGLMGEVGSFTQSRGLKERDWYVVRKAHMPSVLVEAGFVTNAQEVALLNNPVYLKNLSRGIYNGITDFIQEFESVSQ